MKLQITFLLIAAASFTGFAQCTEAGLTKTFGGLSIDVGHSIAAAADGSGYLVAGSTESFGSGSVDLMVVKFNNYFQFQWARAIGTADEENGSFVQVLGTVDGGYLMAGYRLNNSDTREFLFGKLNNQGEVQWMKKLPSSFDTTPRAVFELNSGDCVFIGTSNLNISSSDGLFIRTDADGNVLHKKYYGSSGNDHFTAMVERPNGNLVCMGSNESYDGTVNPLVMEFDADMEILHEKVYAGSGDEQISDAVIDASGNIYAAGWTEGTSSSSRDCLVMKLNDDLDVVWQKHIGGDEADYATSIHITTEGKLFVAGNTQSIATADAGFLLFSLNTDGELAWSKSMSFTEDESPFYYSASVLTDTDQLVIASGSTSFSNASEMALHVFNACGDNGCSIELPVDIDEINLNEVNEPIISLDLNTETDYAVEAVNVLGSELGIHDKCNYVGVMENVLADTACHDPHFMEVEVYDLAGRLLCMSNDKFWRENFTHMMHNYPGGLFTCVEKIECSGSIISAARSVELIK